MKVHTILLITILLITVILLSGCWPVGKVVKQTSEEAGPTESSEQPTEQPAEQTAEQQVGQIEQITGQTTEQPEEQPAPQKIALIEVRGQRFIPKDISVSVGTTVIWEHTDTTFPNMKHAITVYGEVQGGPFNYGESFNHTFYKVGEYKYIDSIYKEYTPIGTISVHE